MKHVVLILALTLSGPALAQEDDSSGSSLMDKGARMFFRGLAEEMDPALRGLRDFAEEAGPAMQSFMAEMGPAMVELFDKVKDFSAYHAPEVLPNGDIIMRRKAEEPPLDLPEPDENGEIEL